MILYTECENAVVGHLLTTFSDILNAERCKASDLDGVFLAMLREDVDYGCVIDFNNGSLRSRAPFKEDMWGWDMSGVFFVRYRGNQEQVDQNARSVIGRLAMVFNDPNAKRLGGKVPLARITEIHQPEAEQINDVPFYWISFAIEVIDK